MATVSAAALLLFATPAVADSISANPVAGGFVEGQASPGVLLATFIDTPGGDTASDYTATIDWGDGVTSPGTISGSDSAGWSVSSSGGHTYQEEGTYKIATTIHDSAGATTTSVSQPIVVADAPLSAPPVPGALSTMFTGGGSTAAPNAENAFKAAIGGTDNGAIPREQSSGLRDVNWDGIPTDGSDSLGATSINAHTVSLPPSRVQSWGLRVNGPLAVSDDAFASANAGTNNKLHPFTSPSLAAPFNTNTLELDVIAPTAPGSAPAAAATRGLGAIFTNVNLPNTTWIDYYNGDSLVSRVFAPTAAAGAASFAGALFPSAIVTKVVITLGTAMIFSWDGSSVTAGPANSGSTDLVAADDVVLAEPAPAHPGVSATVGTPFSGAVGTFADANPLATSHDLTSEIDWGDGTIGGGSVSGSGPFTVSGSHTYTAAGAYTVHVSEIDLGGAQRVETFTMTVASRPTTTSVSCAPNELPIDKATRCTATVTDAGAGATAPTGVVSFGSDTAGGGFATGAGCSLSSTPVLGQSSCSIAYIPGVVGSGRHTIAATYGGDAAHAGSGGTALLTPLIPTSGPIAPTTPNCLISPLSRTLSKRARSYRASVSCDLAANLTLDGVATITPKHSRRHTRVSFGSAHGRLAGSGRTNLTLRPTSKVLAQIRRAARAGGHISLSLTLTAVSPAVVGTSKASLGSLKVR